MITADGIQFDLKIVVKSVPISVDGMVIPITIFFAKSRCKQVILGLPWETYTRNGARNLDVCYSEFTISAIIGSEQVTLLATFLGDQRDRFASSWGNVDA